MERTEAVNVPISKALLQTFEPIKEVYLSSFLHLDIVFLSALKKSACDTCRLLYDNLLCIDYCL